MSNFRISFRIAAVANFFLVPYRLEAEVGGRTVGRLEDPGRVPRYPDPVYSERFEKLVRSWTTVSRGKIIQVDATLHSKVNQASDNFIVGGFLGPLGVRPVELADLLKMIW